MSLEWIGLEVYGGLRFWEKSVKSGGYKPRQRRKQSRSDQSGVLGIRRNLSKGQRFQRRRDVNNRLCWIDCIGVSVRRRKRLMNSYPI